MLQKLFRVALKLCYRFQSKRCGDEAFLIAAKTCAALLFAFIKVVLGLNVQNVIDLVGD